MENKKTASKQELLALGLMNTLPALLGAAIAGPEAGAIAAQGSQEGNKMLLEDARLQREEEAKSQERLAKQLEADRVRAEQQEFKRELQENQLRASAENQQATRALTKSLADQNYALRKEGVVQRQQERLRTEAEPIETVLANIERVENRLGNKLENLEINKKGKLISKESKKEQDLPGVSIPGIGRVNFYDTDARKLASDMESVFNIELKTRSGAAVTTPEMQRLRNEFAQGKFNTEAEMVDALQQYKKLAAEALQRAEATFSPETLELREQRRSDLNEREELEMLRKKYGTKK